MIALSLWDSSFRQPLMIRLERAGKPPPVGLLVPVDCPSGEQKESGGSEDEDNLEQSFYFAQERSSSRAHRHQAMRSMERALHIAPGNILFARYLIQVRAVLS